MKKMPVLSAGIISILMMLLLLIPSCITFKVDENEAGKIISLINAGDVEKLTAITATPFLLDGEIIALPDDAGFLWQNLKEAGFALQNPLLAGLAPVTDETYKLFSEDWEVSVFFKKYVPKDSKLAEIKTADGTYLLLLDGNRRGSAQILGMRGPVQ